MVSLKKLNPLSLIETLIPVEKKMVKKPGLPPGTLVYVGPKREKKTIITVIDYDNNRVEEKEIKDIALVEQYKDRKSVSWINVDGIEQVEIVETINNYFGVHHLVAEDILNTNQRPKAEDYNDYIFFCMKMITLNAGRKKVISEHVSFIIGEDYVLSFQESHGDVFDVIRERIRKHKGRVRSMGADYLAFCLLDAIIDHYFLVFDAINEMIEVLEGEILKGSEKNISHRNHLLKRDLTYLRKRIAPLREVVGGLQRMESKLISKETGLYLRDAYDHTIQVLDTLDTQRDMVSNLHDVYLSTISNRMNEVMKVLTIFASIFIPLTFIVGIYGMNFDHMPELHWQYGYFGVLSLMTVMGTTMLIYFKIKKWI